MLKQSLSVDMSTGFFKGWKNSFIPDWFFMCAMLQPYSPTITFFGDALEWWERKSSDTQLSRNESIKWLPQRSCYIFKCLWEYLQSCLVSRRSSKPEEFAFWITLSACGLVRCTVLWNGSLVQQVAQRGNSITSLRDPSLRCVVPR